LSQPQIIKIAFKAGGQSAAAPATPRSVPDSAPPPASSTETTSSETVGAREWWAQRWVDVLESFGWRRRLERARNYVREGRVLSLEFQGAKVIATVQGTAPEPYDVDLALDPFSEEQWHYAIEQMSGRAIFAAKLLAGEMPRNIEEAFIASGLSLFPFSKFDIHSHCSCPDPVNPCKHIGAVYYLLGDYFGQDPFILFQLRGKTKQEIMATLRQLRTAHSTPQADADEDQLAALPLTSVKLDDSFWHYQAQLDSSLVVIAPPPSSETILDVLGPIPVEAANGSRLQPSGQRLIMEYLQKIYQQASQAALIKAMTSGGQD
jgi:uncharacterized Zn finger protein